MYEGSLGRGAARADGRARRSRHARRPRRGTRRSGPSRSRFPTRATRVLTRDRARAARRLPGSAPAASRAGRPETRAVALVARARPPGRRPATRPTSSRSTTEGNACVLTSSLGLGAGDWLPGLDLHLNSMLGEADLIREPLEPGAADGQHDVADARARRRRPRLRRRRRRRDAPAQRARAGAGRELDEGLAPATDAIDRPRLHPAAGPSTSSRGSSDEVAPALEAAGYARARLAGAAPLTSAASASSRGRARPVTRGGAGPQRLFLR